MLIRASAVFEYQATKNTLLDFYYGAAYYGRNVQVNPVGGARNIGYGFAGSANTQQPHHR